MYESAVKERTSAEAEVVAGILVKFQSAFSKNEWDIGLSNLTDHSINTGDAMPIKQRPGRVPLAFANEERAAIDDLVKKGVVRQSSSPGHHRSYLSGSLAQSDHVWTIANSISLLMELALQGLQWTTYLVDIDDVICFGRDFGEHMERVAEVLQRLSNAGLKLKPEKCKILQTKFTYEIAPVFTLMEETVLQRIKQLIGWSDGDAIFAPGGAISNLYGLMVARHVADPGIKHTGMADGRKFAVFTSAQSNFSIKKAAVLLGIGLDNVYSIQMVARGRMNVAALEEAVQSVVSGGTVSLFVNATCGTTVLGAFDPVNPIADVCEKYGMWMHIDGAWTGSVLFTEKYRYLLDGVNRADSMTWNPHKMMGVPLQCSAIFDKKHGVLQSANELGADYLYQKDNVYDTSFDTGDKAIQCGRHNDVFKLWLMWRSKGDDGFRDQIEKNFEMAKYNMLDKLKAREDFELVLEEIEGPNVCFWYTPEKIRTIKSHQDRSFQLHKLTACLKGLMMEKGSMLLQYQPLGSMPNFFRIAFSNSAITRTDLDFVVQEIVDLAEKLQ
ncbi:glutamate decarboxylase 1-like [Mya arenaria]|uniref:glutamate decarboxylase 1-like n=1 Tax=Mya arenaria TaxID=6604 RepID=UPI0022E9752B|nr:glutamate decarboxylase 1-like [Mya arenaria]